MPTFTSPFTGTVVQPTDVSYYALEFSTDQVLYWPAVVNPTQVPAARIMDCTPLGAGLNVDLPQGDQGSVGSDILFRNFGSYSFNIVDYSGDSSVTIAPGESKYFYLSDNSTVDGVWQNVTFGTGTSSADAATLQSYGLTTLNGKLATTQNVVEASSSPTILDSSRAATFVWTSGTGSFLLPPSANLTAGWFISFRNNGTGTLTIAGTGTSLINGQSSITANPGDSGLIAFQASTGNFFTVGLSTPSNVTFTSATYDVDTIVGSTFSLVSYAPIIQTYVSLSGTRTTDLNITLPATTQLYIISNNTTGSYNLIFNVSGGTSPDVTLTAGQVATILSDGNTLYVLSQSTAGSFFANDGSAAAPSYSFNNDTTTGMYLIGTSILGFSANGVEFLKLDNTNLSSPQMVTDATFTAGLITGGTF